MKYLKEGKNCVGGRNTEKQALKCAQGGQNTIKRFNCLGEYDVSAKDGISRKIINLDNMEIPNNGQYPPGYKHYRSKPNKSEIKNELVCPFIYLSSPDNSVPQIENCHLYCIDEFLAGNEKMKFVCENPLYIIRQMMKRTVRDFENINPCLFLLGNPHNECEADILSQLDIYPDPVKLYNLQDEIWGDIERGILYICILDTSDGDNERLKQQSIFFESWMQEDSTYHFQRPEMKRIIKPNYDNLVPICKFAVFIEKKIARTIFCVDKTTGKYFLVKDNNKGDDIKLITGTFDFRCCNIPGITFIGNDEELMKKVYNQIYTELAKNNVYFDTVGSEAFCIFIKQLCQKLMPKETIKK